MLQIRLNFFPRKIKNPFVFCIPVGKSIIAKQIYRDCLISNNHKKTMDDLVELDMVELDVILDIDRNNAYYLSIDCRTEVFMFHISNELVIDWSSSSSVPKGHFIS